MLARKRQQASRTGSGSTCTGSSDGTLVLAERHGDGDCKDSYPAQGQAGGSSDFTATPISLHKTATTSAMVTTTVFPQVGLPLVPSQTSPSVASTLPYTLPVPSDSDIILLPSASALSSLPSSPALSSLASHHALSRPQLLAAVLTPILILLVLFAVLASRLLYNRRRRTRDRQEWVRTHREIADAVRERQAGAGTPVRWGLGGLGYNAAQAEAGESQMRLVDGRESGVT
ncbi:unnamed protein product [Mycena citricolor]|uniref:Uncharacterized protein n=1 Tax=Mycena citricolor TaxID=2018698 RepID=A0AAD2H0U7_9AGAR|nr:unnamed protein product [Mycena citricolor]